MKNSTPYDVVNKANTFRLFLRNTFYPAHVQDIKENIICYIPGCENTVEYDQSNFEYKAKCNEEYSKNITIEVYNLQIALLLIRVFTTSNDLIQSIIHTTNDKDILLEVYRSISEYPNMSRYIPYLYNCNYLTLNNNLRIVSIYL